MLPRKRRLSTCALLADTVGAVHFLAANLIILLGEKTTLFVSLNDRNPGVRFVYDYLDAPIYTVLLPFVEGWQVDALSSLVVSQVVIIISTIVYGLIAYVLFRIIAELFF